jgi:hypothetical protein
MVSNQLFSNQWMKSSVIHDTICSLIHKKCHPKSYHSDTKYHMTQNIIFSVVWPVPSWPVASEHMINVRGHPCTVCSTYCHQRPNVLELRNCNCVNAHMPLPFQSSKVYNRLVWACPIPTWCTRAYE